MIASADGTGERTLDTGRPATGRLGPGLSWSPDARLIAAPYFGPDTNYSFSLAVLDIATGQVKRLTTHVWQNVVRVAWLPDQSGIVFAAIADGESNGQLWLAEYPSGQWRRITNDLHNYESASLGVTSDGSTIVASQLSDDAKVWVAHVNGDNAVPVSTGSGSHRVGWTSGHRVLYRSTAPGDSLWTVGTDGSQQQARVDLREGLHDISVVPGHDWIVYTRPASGAVNVWRLSLDGRRRERLTEEGVNLVPQVTPDGTTVFFTRPEAGGPSLWKVPATGGEKERALDDVRPLAISPDGHRIAGALPPREPGPLPVPIVRVADGC